MQVNNAIWGASDTWTVATALTPSSGATDDTNLFYYHGIFNSLGDYVDNNIFEYGTAIDDTICYSAHAAAEKMPLADIEYIDYTGNPVGDQTNNAGWFLSYKTSSAANLPYYDAYVLISQMGSTTIQGELSRCYRWCPAGLAQDTTHNPRPTNYHQELAPIVQFSPRSAFYVIMVELITLNHKTRTTITLKELKDNFVTYAGTYYISRAYMIPYTYRGRNANNPTQFNDYAAFSSRYFGASMINGVSFETGEVISYYQTVGRGGSLPIIGVSYTEKLDSTHCGTRVFKRQSSGVNEFYVPVYSRNKVSTISTIHYGTANENYMAYVETDVYIGVVEDIIRGAAAYGLFFTDHTYNDIISDTTNEQRWINENMCLGILDDDGLGHGEYTKGIYNITNPIFNYDTSQDSKYNPKKDIDTNTYSNQTTFNVIGAGASMNKRYLLDAANVNKLATDLFNICDTMSQNSDYSFFDSKVKANMLTQSPIESIVSLIRYPFTPTHGSTKQTVKLGRFDASAEGYPISNAIQTITFKGVDIFPRFGNCFLDYEPYTKYEVYVPFCDTVELSAADILGHTLNVRLVVDLFTGVCTGYILADSLCIETTTGNVGVNLPLTGLDTATINANIANAEANKKAAKKNYIKGHFDIITQKDKVGALWTQILGTNEDIVKKADYDLKHIEAPMHTIGAASPVTSWAMDLNARIMIYYPTGDAVTNDTPPALRDLSTYAHTTGFATIDNAALSNYSGFTVATNAILNFAATTTEKEMIESALNGGIFI